MRRDRDVPDVAGAVRNRSRYRYIVQVCTSQLRDFHSDEEVRPREDTIAIIVLSFLFKIREALNHTFPEATGGVCFR